MPTKGSTKSIGCHQPKAADKIEATIISQGEQTPVLVPGVQPFPHGPRGSLIPRSLELPEPFTASSASQSP